MVTRPDPDDDDDDEDDDEDDDDKGDDEGICEDVPPESDGVDFDLSAAASSSLL